MFYWKLNSSISRSSQGKIEQTTLHLLKKPELKILKFNVKIYIEYMPSVLHKREWLMWILISVVAVLIALAISGILILAVGGDPLTAYMIIFSGGFGSVHAITETLTKASPLLLVGLGMAIAFKCSIWNIGGEGQLCLGAITSTWVGLTFGDSLGFMLFPLTIIAGFLGGALWAVIPGIFKTKFDVNEIIPTLMMNFIAIFLVNYLVLGPWLEPRGMVGQTVILPSSAWLPGIIGENLHAGLIMGLIGAVLLYVILHKTTLGYKIRSIGVNPRAARYGGMSITKTIIIVMIISGGLAGLAGVGEVYGLRHRLIYDVSSNYGYLAILVALLGRNQPIGVIATAILFGGLLVGTGQMHRIAGIPESMIWIIQALIFLSLVGFEYLQRRG